MNNSGKNIWDDEQELANQIGITVEELNEQKQEIAESYTYPVLLKILDKELFDLSRINDQEYLWRVVKDNIKDIFKPGFEVSIVIHHEFTEVAEHCIETQKYSTAIILIATAIEHVINLYYRELLSDKGLPEEEITGIIKKSNVDAKLGWLLTITSNTTLPTNLVNNIKKVFELRNAIVHHKYAPEKMDVKKGSWGNIETKLEEMGFAKIINIPKKLDLSLTKVLFELTPKRKIAHEIWQVLFKKTPNKSMRLTRKLKN